MPSTIICTDPAKLHSEMIAPLSEQQIRRYARHLVLGAVGMRGQRALLAGEVRVDLDSAAAHVAVAYLAAAGVGRIALGGDTAGPIDAAEVAGAPLLLAEDVGRPRGQAIAERVAELNPDVEITEVSDAAGDAEPLDLEATDDPAAALIAGGLAAARAVARICNQEEP